MKKVNCLVVDDEPLARRIIETYITNIPGWTTVGSCINAMEAYDVLQQHPVDVLFLDIRMPVISGIDFLRSLPHRPLVVFTTAYSEHAATGFDLNAVDYLLKPITRERFDQAVEKVTQRLLATNLPPAPPPDYIFIKHDSKLIRLNYDDILLLEAKRDFTSIHLKTKKILAGMHLKALEAMLSPQRMVRVHRSYIVNLDAIQSIEGNTLGVHGLSIPIGTNYKAALYRSLGL